jgi:hypothetical protein
MTRGHLLEISFAESFWRGRIRVFLNPLYQPPSFREFLEVATEIKKRKPTSC